MDILIQEGWGYVRALVTHKFKIHVNFHLSQSSSDILWDFILNTQLCDRHWAVMFFTVVLGFILFYCIYFQALLIFYNPFLPASSVLVRTGAICLKSACSEICMAYLCVRCSNKHKNAEIGLNMNYYAQVVAWDHYHPADFPPCLHILDKALIISIEEIHKMQKWTTLSITLQELVRKICENL